MNPSFRTSVRVIALVLCAAGTALAVPPALFVGSTLDEARRQAADAGKLLVVDFTASWCGPCKKMDRTTWADPKVVEWMKGRAIAVQVDVDRQPDLAASMQVTAMPTVIVFRGNEAFDRVTGYQTTAQLLEWLEGVSRGRRQMEGIRAAANEQGPDGAVNVDAKYDLAKTLADAGNLDESTDVYVWLWEHMLEHKPSMYGVRLSFMVSDMRELAARHPPARKRFAEMRDAARKRMDSDPADVEACADWRGLSEAVGDNGALLVWFDAVRADPARKRQIDRLEYDLTEELIAASRWRDAGLMVDNPAVKAEREISRLAMSLQVKADLDDEAKASLDELDRQQLRGSLSKLHACCLAAARDADAAKVAKLAFKGSDGGPMRVAFVEMALKAGVSRPMMEDWLKEAAAQGVRIGSERQELQEALKAPKGLEPAAGPPAEMSR